MGRFWCDSKGKGDGAFTSNHSLLLRNIVHDDLFKAPGTKKASIVDYADNSAVIAPTRHLGHWVTLIASSNTPDEVKTLTKHHQKLFSLHSRERVRLSFISFISSSKYFTQEIGEIYREGLSTNIESPPKYSVATGLHLSLLARLANVKVLWIFQFQASSRKTPELQWRKKIHDWSHHQWAFLLPQVPLMRHFWGSALLWHPQAMILENANAFELANWFERFKIPEGYFCLRPWLWYTLCFNATLPFSTVTMGARMVS